MVGFASPEWFIGDSKAISWVEGNVMNVSRASQEWIKWTSEKFIVLLINEVAVQKKEAKTTNGAQKTSIWGRPSEEKANKLPNKPPILRPYTCFHFSTSIMEALLI